MNIQDLKDIICIVSEHFSGDINFPEKFMASIEEKLKNNKKLEPNDIVIEVFQEMGKEDMIPFYQTYVEEKEQIYQNLKHIKEPRVTLLVGPTSNDQYIPWETNKIARALEREGGIPQNVSERVAHSVEDKVIQSGIRYISTTLIRELVNSELFLSGYGYYMKKQSVLGIPKYNLNNTLYPRNQGTKAQNVHSLSNFIAENTYRQYALEEVYSKEVIQAHLSGAIHIEDLEWSVKLFSLNAFIPQEYYFQKNEESIELLTKLLSNISHISQFVSNSFRIYNADSPNINWTKFIMRAFFYGLDKNRHSLNYYVILQNTESSFIDNLHKLAKDKDFLRNVQLPIFCFPLNEKTIQNEKYLKKVYSIYAATNSVHFYLDNYFFNADEKPLLDSAISGFVINLYRIVFNVNKKNKEKIWQNLKEIFDLIVKAHLDKKRFLFNLVNSSLKELLDPQQNIIAPTNIKQAACYLAIAGLPEAVYYLCQSDMSEGEGWETALEILQRLNEMIFNLEDVYDIRIKLVDYSCSKSPRRFAKLDKTQLLLKSTDEACEEYTFGPHFPDSVLMGDTERILKEGQLHQYMKSCISASNIKDYKSLYALLQFTLEETSSAMLRIKK